MKKKLLTKNVKIVLGIALALAVFVTLGAALRQGQSTGENVVSTLLAPLRSAVAAFDRGAEQLYGYLFRYEKLEAENAQLRSQIAAQDEAIRTAESYQRENQRLRDLLSLSEEHPDYSFSAAYVIGWSADRWESTITIDCGTADGIQPGMCAVTEQRQVVGLVSQAGPNWATVTTIYDSSSQISAAVGTSGSTGVVEGTRDSQGNNLLKMQYLSTNATLKNGDSVVTTGSTLYPRGLLLGTVVSAGLDENGVSKYAFVNSEFTPDGLEQIFIITDYLAD